MDSKIERFWTCRRLYHERVRLMTNRKIFMTHDQFTGAILTLNDLDPSGTRILRASEFSVVNSTEIAHSACFMNRDTTDKIIVYAKIRKLDNNPQRYKRRFS